MQEKLAAHEFEIIHNEPCGQWEIRRTPEAQVIGYLSYDINETEIFFTSTVVRKEFQGQGLAQELLRTALDYERNTGGHKIVPICSYVQNFVEKNPEYQDLLA